MKRFGWQLGLAVFLVSMSGLSGCTGTAPVEEGSTQALALEQAAPAEASPAAPVAAQTMISKGKVYRITPVAPEMIWSAPACTATPCDQGNLICTCCGDLIDCRNPRNGGGGAGGTW